MTTKTLQAIKSIMKVEFDVSEAFRVLNLNRAIIMSWGVSKKTNFNNRVLVLKVNAHRHKGYVAITLNGNDTYCVDLIKTSGNIFKTFSEVYVDELTSIIDEEIEKVEEYSY